MYPVMSLLRRYSAAFILVRKKQLLVAEGHYFVRLASPSPALDLGTGKWGPSLTQAPMSELVIRGKSSEEVAIRLAKRENELAEQVGARDSLYTLVAGPEIEEAVDGEVVRRCRLAVVSGVYRASPPKEMLERASSKDRKRYNYSKLPKGAIEL